MIPNIIKHVYRITGFNENNHNSFKNPVFVILSILLCCSILLAYSNHFSNGFHFDDAHTIQNNNAIKELNILLFFKDGTTISTLPTNQSYRPYTTLENAIDYKIGNGLNPKIFHIHIFMSFILTCFLLLVFVKMLLNKISFSKYNQFWGLLIAAIFSLLCANTETVNYIIQRAEIVSCLYILLGFIAYFKGGFWKHKCIYLLFPFVGFFVKEMTFVFSPLLLLYFLIFEENVDLLHFYKKNELFKVLKSIKKTLPAIILTALFLIFYIKMLPKTFSSGGLSHIKYLITQPLVICHYILTFFYPYNLSADSDWVVFNSILDYRAIIGIILLFGILWLALKSSKNKETRLFSFGILWFFISLLPTSSIIPFSEVLNDHRSFIPYIGLTIAFVFGVKYIIENYLPKMINQKIGQVSLVFLVLLFLSANALGIHQRNKVWENDLSLWKDVSIKSPKNERGFMNYGLALMANGDYINAEIYYNKALKLNPNYSYLYINLGILKNAIGDKIAAENNFKKAFLCPDATYNACYYYGEFLVNENRFNEAILYLKKALEMSPNYSNTYELLMKSYHNINDWENLKQIAKNRLKVFPNDITAKKYLSIALNKTSVFSLLEEEIIKSPTAEKYLNLSLKYFNHNRFKKCIDAAKKALKFKPDYPEALNNIGIAYLNLNEYQQAINYYQQALKINPNFILAQNNLAFAISILKENNTKIKPLSNITQAKQYLNLSLFFYNKGNYLKAIESAKKSIAIQPSANAYNNICSAYNQLKNYDKAIKACQEALKLNPNHKLAKGNLNFAIKKKLKN